MRPLRSLRWRLILSYLVVVAVGAVTILVVARWTAPRLFRGHMEGMGRGMAGIGSMAADLDLVFASSLSRALLVSLTASSLASLVIGGLMARRILRPVEQVRAATHRLAAGRYDERVVPPAEEELAALADDLNVLGRTLAETERNRMRLISEVAHELRTPLTSIEGYMEGLIDGVFPATAETFASVAEEAGRLKRLAGDLSTLSRVEEGAVALDLKMVDLGELVRTVAEHLRPQFLDEDVRLAVDVPSIVVRSDPDRLTQALVNLLGNALAHTPAGGEVSVGGHERAGRALIAVTDSGQGIAGEDLGRVFDRFYRGTGARPGGSGIGLTIARAVVRAHGGDVTASSPGPGKGSTFTIELPAR